MFLFTAIRLASFGADSIVVVAHPDELAPVSEALEAAGLPDCRVVAGGADRQSSVAKGLSEVRREFVAVHDAARPFVSKDEVLSVLRKVRSCGAVSLGFPARDTLARTTPQAEQGCARMVETLQRSHVWNVQTPQVFRRDLLERAHRQAALSGVSATDDAGLVERLGVAVQLVRGSVWNLKVTEPEDLWYVRLWEASQCGSV